ncbi:MAG: hypothetical protein AB7O21_06370 [Gammaproteobacteria bacterium]
MRIWLLLVGIALGAAVTLWLTDATRGPLRDVGTRTPDAPAADAGSDEDDDDDDAVPVRVRQIDGDVVVVLRPEEIRLADLDTAPPARVEVAAMEKSFGRVADPAPVLEAARTAGAARAAAAAQRTVIAALAQRLSRLRQLAAAGEITVARELADLEVQLRREQATATARDAALAAADGTLVARWGTALAAGAAQRAPWFQALAAGEAQLVEFGARVPPPATITASPQAQAEDPRPVEVIGAAPTAFGAAQIPTYHGIARDPRLRVGMQLTCLLPHEAPATAGWLVPGAALVWHDGAQWFYVRSAPGEFRRHRADGGLPHAGGRVLVAGLTADSAVVVRGAQALLAEEFRAHIPEEDDD